ncbi:HNH/endonuclease VII fold toxin-2 domain-containing protein [Chitinimonas sp. JJ19]
MDGNANAKDCDKDFKKIKEECAKDDANDPKEKRKVRTSMSKLLGSKYKSKGYNKTLSDGGMDNKSWMADHCDFLWIKPGPESHQKFLEKVNDLRTDLKDAVDGALTKMIDEAKDRIKQEAIDLAKKKAGEAAVRAGGRWVVGASGAAVGGVGAIVTEGIATVWNLCDIAKTGYQVATTGYDTYKDIDKLDDVLKRYTDIGKELERLQTQAKADPQKAVADMMGNLARANPCTRARRCSLVPFKDQNQLDGRGCCPGQTGHHVMPGEMVGWSESTNKYTVDPPPCPGYDHAKAPTICVEGANNTHGTHGAVHGVLKKSTEMYKGKKGTNAISYTSAREMAISSVQTTFPESGCDRKCLRAQLDDFYKNICKGNVLAESGGGPAEEINTRRSN